MHFFKISLTRFLHPACLGYIKQKLKAMKRIFFILSLFLSLSSAAQTGSKNISCTTTDLKQSYEIVKIVTGFASLNATVSDANFSKAYSDAWSKLAYEASKVGADAVVGIKMEQIKSTDGKSDKLVVYGTAVKLK